MVEVVQHQLFEEDSGADSSPGSATEARPVQHQEPRQAGTDRDCGSWQVEMGEECTSWQVVVSDSEALRRPKVERLQNCGVLGLRCVLEVPRRELDGWVDVEAMPGVG